MYVLVLRAQMYKATSRIENRKLEGFVFPFREDRPGGVRALNTWWEVRGRIRGVWNQNSLSAFEESCGESRKIVFHYKLK